MPRVPTLDEHPITVFDIGGTHMRRARWRNREAERLSEYSQQPSPTHRRYPDSAPDKLQERLVSQLCDAVPREPAAIVGVSLGAALDHRFGTVYASAPMWGSLAKPFDLRTALSEARPDAKWHIVNDVTAALLHHASTKRCQDHRKVLLATISTGIACRTIDRSRGEIPVDGCGLQGEIGHLPAYAEVAGKPVELPCDCGAPGHVAAYSSGPGIKMVAEVLRQRSARRWEQSILETAVMAGAEFETALRTALDRGDSVAGELLAVVTGPIARVLATTLCLEPDIDHIALTGGVVTGLGKHYRDAVLRHLLSDGLYLTSQLAPDWIATRIAVCGPGEANGLIGAGIAAFTAEERARRGVVA